MADPVSFPCPPQMEPLGNGKWRLCHPYRAPAYGTWVRIPEGFETDLASIPRILTPFIQRDELGRAAAPVHDALYQWAGRIYTDDGTDLTLRRRQVDALFRLLMRLEGVPAWRRTVAWLAVRLAGWACWRDYKGRTTMIVNVIETAKQALAGVAATFAGGWATLAALAGTLKIDVSAGKQAVLAAVSAAVVGLIQAAGNLVKQWRAKARPVSAEVEALLVEAQGKIEAALGAL